MSATLSWKQNPDVWASSSDSMQAALIRRDQGLPPLARDADEIDRMAGCLVSYMRAKGTTSHQPFQTSYGESLVRHSADLRHVFERMITDQWRHKGKIGHYELYAGLLLGNQDADVLAPTLTEIHGLLQTWNNKGWCPWTPALWMRILWLGRDQLDSSDTLAAQLAYIDEHLDADGQFQDREPCCLMHAVGLMDHPGADRLRDRFIESLVARQADDGSWGDFSYIALTLIHHWGL